MQNQAKNLRVRLHRPQFSSIFENLAYEEALFGEKRPRLDIALWTCKEAVSIGRHQNFWSEVVPWKFDTVRRTTGGGAVYHDPGSLQFSLKHHVEPSNFSVQALQKASLEFVGSILQRFNPDIKYTGRNDFSLGDLKISGNAFRCTQSSSGVSFLHHGTLLCDSNLEKMAAALRPSNAKLSGHGVSSVRKRVTNLNVSTEAMTQFWLDQVRKTFPEVEEIEPADVAYEKYVKDFQNSLEEEKMGDERQVHRTKFGLVGLIFYRSRCVDLSSDTLMVEFFQKVRENLGFIGGPKFRQKVNPTIPEEIEFLEIIEALFSDTVG